MKIKQYIVFTFTKARLINLLIEFIWKYFTETSSGIVKSNFIEDVDVCFIVYIHKRYERLVYDSSSPNMRYGSDEYVNRCKNKRVCLLVFFYYFRCLSSTFFIGSLIFFAIFCGPLFVFLFFSFGHCIFCHSIYGFWWTLGNLQTCLTDCLCYNWTVLSSLSNTFYFAHGDDSIGILPYCMCLYSISENRRCN